MARDNYLDIPRFCAQMRGQSMAAVVASSPSGVFHTSGALIITHNPLRDRLAFCITTANGDQCLAVCAIEKSLCEHDSWVKDIRDYVEFQELPTHLLAKTLADLGLNGKTVGIDLDYLRESYFRELVAAAPDINFVAADTLLLKMRAIKPAGQFAHMRNAARVLHAGMAQVLREPMVGKAEREIRKRFRQALIHGGADGCYVAVAAGPNARTAEHRAGDHVLAPGEPLVLDAAVTCDGYIAEAATSVVLGTPMATDATSILDASYRKAVQALKVGARAGDIYEAASEGARASGGLLVGSGVGHSISFGGREPPFLTRESDDVLEAGMSIVLDITCENRDGLRLRKKDLWLFDGGEQPNSWASADRVA
jgi:Xaa-Pro aminopeptidase